MHYAARMLSSKQRAHLQALAHDKKPVILLGHKGITDSLLAETKAALLAHELIKCRLAEGEGDALDTEATALADGAGAELVARVGRMAILYRAHPDKQKQKIRLPKPPKKGLFDLKDDAKNDAKNDAGHETNSPDDEAGDD